MPPLQSYTLSISACLGLVQIPNQILINRALFIARYHIYDYKTRGIIPRLPLFLKIVSSTKGTEKQIACEKGKMEQFEKNGRFLILN